MPTTGRSVAELSVSLGAKRLAALRARAARLGVGVDALIEEYVAYLLAGGDPVGVADGELDVRELGRVAHVGGSFDWLADEPDIYSSDDGEPL